MRKILAAFLFVFLFAGSASALRMEDVVRITPGEVMAEVERGEKVLIVDLRSRGAYRSSPIRIKGDLRIAPDELEGKLYTLPMSGEIITYCT
ncbi:MAG: hypothetical protein ACE5EB_08970 [Thermodesulfobacteriota bacterium]